MDSPMLSKVVHTGLDKPGSNNPFGWETYQIVQSLLGLLG